MSFDAPPRNLILDMLTWLRTEIYIGLVGHPLDDEGIAAWVCDRYVSLWNTLQINEPQQKHQAAKNQIYREIEAIVFPVPIPPAPPTPGSPFRGTLRIVGLAYVDDSGPVLPIFVHLGDGYSRFTRDRDAVLRLLDDIAGAGWHGVRFWSCLRGSYWAGRECDAGRTPDSFAAFGQELVARGLQAVVSQGDMWQADGATRQGIKYAIRTAFPREAIAFLDAGNEVNNNPGGIDPSECAEWIIGLPGILSLSTTQSEEPEDLRVWSRAPAMIWDEHSSRAGNWWDWTRHVRNLTTEGAPEDRRLGIGSEGPGFGRRVSGMSPSQQAQISDDVMAFMGAVSLAHRQALVWFSGPGVMSDEGERLQDMPGFRSVPALAALLPRDVMTYSRLVHGGSSQGSQRIFAVTDEPGTTRCDHVIAADGHAVIFIYGPNPQYRQARDFDIAKDRTLQNGQMRLIVGRLR